MNFNSLKIKKTTALISAVCALMLVFSAIGVFAEEPQPKADSAKPAYAADDNTPEFEITPSEATTEPTSEPTTGGSGDLTPGDANGDGKVNSQDILLIKRYNAAWDVQINLENSDVTGDGKVNSQDVLKIKKYNANIIDKL